MSDLTERTVLDQPKMVQIHEQQLVRTSEIAIDELREQAREATAYGYDYLETSKVENALIALAVVNGAYHVNSLESALEYIAELDVKAVRDNVETLETDKSKLEDTKSDLEDRVELLEKILNDHKEATEGVLVTSEDASTLREVLTDAHNTITRFPGRRQLAQRAFKAISLIDDETMVYVPVDQDKLEEAFPKETDTQL